MTASSPTVPWRPVRVYNAVAGRLPWIPDELPHEAEFIRAATADAGPDPDLGDDAWRPALGAFLAALRCEADLTPAGRRFAGGVILAALRNRARIERAIADDPEITRRPPGPAIVVVGLPRSGTTLLQHLLDLDPHNRSLRQWEAADPAPPPGQDPSADLSRVRAAERATWLLDRMAPQARVLHPTGPRLPTECVTLFTNSLASLELGVIYQVPSYVRWCLATDPAPFYAYYVRQLQLLARYERRARWALKSPAHLFWLDELMRALPESRIVYLQRDPVEVLASFCQLVTVLSAPTTRRVDPLAVGALWSEVWAEGVRRARAVRDRAGAGRWVDVQYTELVADPAATVAGVYEAFDLPFRDGLAGAIGEHVTAHPRRRGDPRHTLEDFGLDAATERRRFIAAASTAADGYSQTGVDS